MSQSDELTPTSQPTTGTASAMSSTQPPRILRASQNAMIGRVDQTWRSRGRCIRRLVSLQDPIQDLVDEADRRGALLGSNQSSSPEQNRLFKNYELLVTWIPEFGQWVTNASNAGELNSVVKELTDGADSARSDDTANIKKSVVNWLMEIEPTEPSLRSVDKSGRGFHHNGTGRLLCPVDYDWENPEERQKVKNWHPKYLVTANSWPRFLYEEGEYDPENPTKGLMKGAMLVQTFRMLFTSPSSAESIVSTTDRTPVNNKRRRGERRTRPPVASLIRMKKVDPRAIAYAAVQLRFALSDCGSWRPVHGIYDYDAFYQHIVSWFEDIDHPEEIAFIEDILLWWNLQIFGREGVLDYAPQAAGNLSVAASFKRRRL